MVTNYNAIKHAVVLTLLEPWGKSGPMAQPYVGEIRLFAGNFAPAGWMLCEGQHLNISEYETLFNLIGTTYGGDGQSTFALPDLRGRVPVHQGQGLGLSGYVIGETGGTEEVTLTLQQIPSHNHALLVSDATGDKSDPSNCIWAQSDALIYSSANPNGTMASGSLASGGENQPHDNMMPYLCIYFIISLFGIFPSQN